MRDLHISSWLSLGRGEARGEGLPEGRLRGSSASSSDRRTTEARIELFANDVRSRIRPVCTHWDEDEFEVLVQRIAQMKLRWTETGRGD